MTLRVRADRAALFAEIKACQAEVGDHPVKVAPAGPGWLISSIGPNPDFVSALACRLAMRFGRVTVN